MPEEPGDGRKLPAGGAQMPNPMRRPSDLRREAGRGPTSWFGPLAWPPGFASDRPDREALAVLLHLASVPAARLLELSAEHPTARACLAAIAAGAAGSPADRSRARDLDGREAIARVVACGARLVAVGDPEYPAALLDLFDPPAGLLVRGRSIAEASGEGWGTGRRVAVVGARNCSATGREIAGLLASAVARVGGCVVSGGARGIDEAAHRGALSVAAPAEEAAPADPARMPDQPSPPMTVAVLGCGIDSAYPPRNRRLFDDVARLGAVVSEYPPRTPPEPFRFPARNRIVAAMSSAVVVVEGAIGSGSMITVDHAAAVGRDVYAVPGSPLSDLSAVPLKLIRDGAGMIRGADDLLCDLGLIPLGPDPSDPGGLSRPIPPPPDATPVERAVWTALSTPAAVDTVAGAAALSIPQAMAALAGLEVRGFVRQVGGRFERTLSSGVPSDPPVGWS